MSLEFRKDIDFELICSVAYKIFDVRESSIRAPSEEPGSSCRYFNEIRAAITVVSRQHLVGSSFITYEDFGDYFGGRSRYSVAHGVKLSKDYVSIKKKINLLNNNLLDYGK